MLKKRAFGKEAGQGLERGRGDLVPGRDRVLDAREVAAVLARHVDQQPVQHRHRLEHVDLVGRDQIGEVAAVGRAVLVDERDAAAVLERRPDVEQAEIEVERRVVRDDGARADVELLGGPVGEAVDGARRERHDLRQPGRARGGEHERDVVAAAGRRPLRRLLLLGGRVLDRAQAGALAARAVGLEHAARARLREQLGERLGRQLDRRQQEGPLAPAGRRGSARSPPATSARGCRPGGRRGARRRRRRQ